MSGEVSGPFRAGQVAAGDRAGALLPGGERRRPGEAVALVVDYEQVLAGGQKRGSGGGARLGAEGGAFLLKRRAGPQLDRSVLTGGRESLAGGVEGDAGNRAGRHGHRARDLIAVERVPQLDDPAPGAGREGPVGGERQRERLVDAEQVKCLPDLAGRGVEEQNAVGRAGAACRQELPVAGECERTGET